MRIEKLANGWRVVIPKGCRNSEMVYQIPIANDGPLFIRDQQEHIARKVSIRAFQMENQFKSWKAPGDYDRWAEKNRVGDWNDWFHTSLREMEEQAWMLYRKWCDWHFEKYGWNAYL